MCHRYATKDGNIMFDDFIMCAVRLKTMIGKLNFNLLSAIKLHIYFQEGLILPILNKITQQDASTATLHYYNLVKVSNYSINTTQKI